MFCKFGFKTYLVIVVYFDVLVKVTRVGPMSSLQPQSHRYQAEADL